MRRLVLRGEKELVLLFLLLDMDFFLFFFVFGFFGMEEYNLPIWKILPNAAFS